MIDTHCHLSHPRLAGEFDALLERARQAGLTACMTIGTGTEDAQQALALARPAGGFVSVAAGIDPFSAHRVGEAFDDELAALEQMLDSEPISALGEIGLDYHYDLDPRPLQAERFERQLEAAAGRDLPVVIHVREAHTDMLAILGAHPGNRGVIHSFTAGPAEAEAYLQIGWHLSYNGVATFKNADEVRQAARITPVERMLVETDSPYLAPMPHRGKRCEPAYVARTLERLALERGEDPDELARQTTRNARLLFDLERIARSRPSP